MTADSAPPGKTSEPIQVLYVDDDPDFLEVVEVILERKGEIAVEICLSGQDALSLLKSGRYDLILSDNRMARMSGIELLGKVRELYPDLPFILFSGQLPDDLIPKAESMGLTAHLIKHGDPAAQFDELERLIRSVVNR